jgi:hypothetical protein
VEDEVMEEQALPDERMQLVFTYCHPALALEEQVVYPSLWNQDQIADGRAKFRPRDRPARAAGGVCAAGSRSLRCRSTIRSIWPTLRRPRSPPRSRAPGREPDAAMAIVHALALDDYQSLRSTRAAYERALLLARAEPERRFLERRLDEL